MSRAPFIPASVAASASAVSTPSRSPAPEQKAGQSSFGLPVSDLLLQSLCGTLKTFIKRGNYGDVEYLLRTNKELPLVTTVNPPEQHSVVDDYYTAFTTATGSTPEIFELVYSYVPPEKRRQLLQNSFNYNNPAIRGDKALLLLKKLQEEGGDVAAALVAKASVMRNAIEDGSIELLRFSLNFFPVERLISIFEYDMVSKLQSMPSMSAPSMVIHGPEGVVYGVPGGPYRSLSVAPSFAPSISAPSYSSPIYHYDSGGPLTKSSANNNFAAVELLLTAMRKTSNDDLQKKCDEIIAGVISRLVDKNNSAYVTAVPVDRSCMALFLFSRISGLGKIDDNAKKQLLETLLPKEEKKQEAVSQAATNVMKDENEMQKKTREQATMILCNPALTGAMIQLNEYFKRNQTLPRPLVDLVTEYVGSFKEQDLLPVIGAACDDQRFKAVFEKSFPQFEWSEKGPKEKPKDAEKKEDKKDQGNQNEAEKAAAYNAERLASLMEYRNLVGAIVTQLTTPSPSPQSPAGNAMRDREGQQQA